MSSRNLESMGDAANSAPKRRKSIEQIDFERDRFILARDRGHRAFAGIKERDWQDPYTFVQMADTQFGLATGIKLAWQNPWYRFFRRVLNVTGDFWRLPIPLDGMPMLSPESAYQMELDFARQSVDAINCMKPKPAFVVVCGDLVNAYPDQPEQIPQVEDFKRIFQKVDQDIQLICTCGNHDVGDRPTAQSISTYRDRFGDDYYSFWCRGVQYFILNSQLIKEPASYPEGTARQDIWLEDMLKQRMLYLQGLSDEEKENPQHMIVFAHHPPFIKSADEPTAYFNLEKQRRLKLLDDLIDAGCKWWFCGHYHRNASGVYKNSKGCINVVVTTAIGSTLTTRAKGGDPLGLTGMDTCLLEEEKSGLRVVSLGEEEVTHEFFTLKQLADQFKMATSYDRFCRAAK